MEHVSDQVHLSGSAIVNLVYHPLTGWRVHVHVYSTWGHASDREEYLSENDMANEAYTVISEHVGGWLLAVKDDLVHTLPA